MTNVQDTTVEHISDQEIIKGVLAGDPLSQGRLYRRYYSKLMTRCKGSLGNQQDADELVNKIFFYLFTKGLDKYAATKGTSVETWLTRYVARDFIYKELKKIRNQAAEEETFSFVNVTDEEEMIALEDRLQSDSDHSPEAILSSAEESSKLQTAIDKLPEKDKELCILLYREGLNLAEAATQLGIKYPTASSRRRRALVRLTEVL